jgi:drug/metabolite transporter (DMT)-like permease
MLGEQIPSLSGMGWGVLAGIFISIALLALYKGLSLGKMGFVAPVSAVVAASVPVIYGAFSEGLPEIHQLAGFAIALLSVWLIAGDSRDIRVQKKDLYLPFIAGAGFGLFFVTIDLVSETAVLWPLTAARIAAVGVLLVFIALSGPMEMPSRNVLPIILVAGVFDTGGNTFYALASQAGRLDIASITSSLYPAGTVLLAWFILKEKLAPRQWLGVASALLAIVLISL